MVRISSGRSAPVGGICSPAWLPDTRWYRRLTALLPGTMRAPLAPTRLGIESRRRSRRKLPFASVALWQP
jgi:hypothetical protein